MTTPPEPKHCADRLLTAIDRLAAPVCVGLDPVLDRLPSSLQPATAQQALQAIGDFSKMVIDAVCEHVPCMKFQSACYERLGWEGVRVLEQVMAHAQQSGLEIILDAKRGDIGISATHYAASARAAGAHWLTINAYLGADSIEPFLDESQGAFALVRTSNPGGDALQQQSLADGGCVADAVARMIATIGAGYCGQRGYSALGAVVGATKASDAARLRELMPQQLFLVPGFGAQGGSVQDILPCFSGSHGAVVTASRSVIYAFTEKSGPWDTAVREAACEFAEQVGSAVGLR
jgi:orotidine-5'-phosphate decarboxylase